ncbi:response regulator transcription factor [Edaphobacter albus]|uniref:response regulator transcription factor n=1 Tax=Edaphobacter sp. 4G125 TaxID=2763071 RepID=UPI00164593C2|nr:response regulator transcription factor [Edaphobacter sp. 4G125]QNI37647.1 response regulator transcription factor [Edaphobacter sp. 4G125]
MQKILVIEDDPRIQKALQRQFTVEGFSVMITGSGTEGVAAAQTINPDAVILDLMLPGMSGRDVCRAIRASLPEIPILILSAVSEIADKVLLLELGADDYITKPFSPRELLARVQVALRRQRREEPSEFMRFGNITADFARMEVRKDGEPVIMTAHELKLLRYFINHPERVITREKLLIDVWGYNSYPTTRTVDNQVMKLRHKLEDDPANPRYFRTMHGIGYKFVGGPS